MHAMRCEGFRLLECIANGIAALRPPRAPLVPIHEEGDEQMKTTHMVK